MKNLKKWYMILDCICACLHTQDTRYARVLFGLIRGLGFEYNLKIHNVKFPYGEFFLSLRLFSV